ncbi:type VI secretion system-associated FHA domain protein TagH [Cellvibrio sp.]
MDIDVMSYSPRLIIKVITYNGASINNNSMLCEFGAGEQITLGRSVGNHLVLDDPSRLVSRVQASLAYKDEASAIINNISSSTGIFIGTAALQPGASAVISLSDHLMIGAYILMLQQTKILSVEKAVSNSKVENAAGFANEINFIPADFDFFSSEVPIVVNASEEMFGERDDNSLLHDELDAPSNNANFLYQTKENSNEKLLHEQSEDPLALLSVGDAGNSSAAYGLDDGNEIDSLFIVPRITKQAESTHHSIDVIESVADVLAPVQHRPKRDSPVKRQSSSMAGISTVLSDAHRQALAHGLQIDEGKLPEFTPEFFELLGSTLLHLTAGAVNMMHERAHIKHEMRADVTIIAASGNNPLKFAPDAQSALMHLIGERVPGFMHSVEAIDDAFDDLLAHQIGLMSGARAAVYDVVKNFSPEKIHKYMVNKNFVDSILPMSKKSKLWELYEAHYTEVAGNAREDFEVRFQQAFSQAYEQEIDRMCEARERT